MTTGMVDEVLAIFREEGLDLTRRGLTALNACANAAGDARKKHLQEVARILHTLKGAAAAVGNDEILNSAHTLEDQVALLTTLSPSAAFDPVFQALERIEASLEKGTAPKVPVPVPFPMPRPELRAAAESEPSIRPKSRRPPSKAAPDMNDGGAQLNASFAEWLRVPPERVDQLQAHLGELVLTRLQQDELIDRMIALRTAASSTMVRQRDLSSMLLELRSELSPDSFRRLRIGTQALVRGFSDFHEGLQSVCRDARVLQAQSGVVSQAVEESIADLRLMPLGPFLEGFARSARDAARKESKVIRFTVNAEGAEVDRTVLTRLHEALLHLVRNAVVHGLESPKERVAKGKASEGSLTLEATVQGSEAEIRIIDDGRGIDAERVRRKAEAIGLSVQEDLLELLTHPGFSTRDEVDDLAGRGVGLDVVASIVRGLNGSLHMSSECDRGTVFSVRVPITASTTMGLILQVGEQRFGIMLSGVERVIRPSADEIERVEGRPSVNVGGELVSLVALADLLGIQESEGLGSRIPVVVLSQARRRLALAVSEIPGEQPLVVRPFGRAFRTAELFVGGAVQADHSVIPVLSTPALFAKASRSPSRDSFETPAITRGREAQERKALVVDDSITMRTMLRNILGAAGYHVTVAEDGAEALTRLDEMDECHVIVTDLQMPRIDGIELCLRVREREGRYVPIVMVTSVDEDEEKTRAISAGADAYVVKASFEQVSFLRRIDALVHGEMQSEAL
jgi:chemotaxis protein histidine kinase CheA